MLADHAADAMMPSWQDAMMPSWQDAMMHAGLIGKMPCFLTCKPHQ
jgi:hypothetical protein